VKQAAMQNLATQNTVVNKMLHSYVNVI